MKIIKSDVFFVVRALKKVTLNFKNQIVNLVFQSPQANLSKATSKINSEDNWSPMKLFLEISE